MVSGTLPNCPLVIGHLLIRTSLISSVTQSLRHPPGPLRLAMSHFHQSLYPNQNWRCLGHFDYLNYQSRDPAQYLKFFFFFFFFFFSNRKFRGIQRAPCVENGS